jgi:hypothetical protein
MIFHPFRASTKARPTLPRCYRWLAPDQWPSIARSRACEAILAQLNIRSG